MYNVHTSFFFPFLVRAMPDIPVVVLGGANVGKSCLTIQYIQGHFVDQYDTTIEDIYRKTINVDNIPAVLTVVDTAGQDAFDAVRDQYLKKGQGFVLVYSITDAESFQHVQRICANLQRVRVGLPTPCVLVGNKVDQVAYRAVDQDKGAQLAGEIGAPFLEITAKDHKMCEQVFEMLMRTIHGNGSASTAGEDAGCGTMASANGAAGANSMIPRASSTTGAAAATAVSAADATGEGDGKAKKKNKKRAHGTCTLL